VTLPGARLPPAGPVLSTWVRDHSGPLAATWALLGPVLISAVLLAVTLALRRRR
jgi:hypothetical protein